MPFIEVITDFMSRGQEKYESALPGQDLMYIPLQCAFENFLYLFVSADTHKWCLIKTEEKCGFILSYFSA